MSTQPLELPAAVKFYIGKEHTDAHPELPLPETLRTVPSGVIRFFVHGDAATAGSKKAFPLWKGHGANKQFVRSLIVDSSGAKGKVWRSVVQDKAREAFGEKPLLLGAILLTLTFHRTRPKNHFGAKGIKASAPKWPTGKPDLTKLTRAIEDALKGVVWKDDSQVVRQAVEKKYAEAPGVWVEIEAIP